MIDKLPNQLNNHSIPINFYINLSKAFDCLRHDILIEKLAYYGVKNKALDLLKSYLSNRKQYVKLNDITSTVRSISVGVPQDKSLCRFFANDPKEFLPVGFISQVMPYHTDIKLY